MIVVNGGSKKKPLSWVWFSPKINLCLILPHRCHTKPSSSSPIITLKFCPRLDLCLHKQKDLIMSIFIQESFTSGLYLQQPKEQMEIWNDGFHFIRTRYISQVWLSAPRLEQSLGILFPFPCTSAKILLTDSSPCRAEPCTFIFTISHVKKFFVVPPSHLEDIHRGAYNFAASVDSLSCILFSAQWTSCSLLPLSLIRPRFQRWYLINPGWLEWLIPHSNSFAASIRHSDFKAFSSICDL